MTESDYDRLLWQPQLVDDYAGHGTIREELEKAKWQAFEMLGGINQHNPERVVVTDCYQLRGGNYLADHLQVISLIEPDLSEAVAGCFDWKRLELVVVKRLAMRNVTGVSTPDTIVMPPDHPNLCRIYEVVETPLGTWISMERLGTANLHTRLRAFADRGSPVSIYDAFVILHGILAGLDEYHRVIGPHGDIKPANVCFGPGGRVKLVDLLDENCPVGVTRRGTVGWRSPEQEEGGDCGTASDIFCVGVIAALLFGAPHPFRDPRNLIPDWKLVVDYPPRGLESVPGDVRQWVRELLQRYPEDRPTAQSALASLSSISSLHYLFPPDS